MRRYIAYFKYVIRHKWYVFWAGLALDCNIWRLLLHDISKFLPSEFIPYARCFYQSNGKPQYNETQEFNQAWNRHQKRNLHHYQSWILHEDSGFVMELPMPEQYIQEMVADWIGAGRAVGNLTGARVWYERNKKKIQLHPQTRLRVEHLLQHAEAVGA